MGKTLGECFHKNKQHLTRIVKKSINSKQIIQILQPIVIDNFSTHSYIVDIS